MTIVRYGKRLNSRTIRFRRLENADMQRSIGSVHPFCKVAGINTEGGEAVYDMGSYGSVSSPMLFADKDGIPHDEGIAVDVDLLRRDKDGNIKEVTAEIPDEYGEGTVTVTMPDHTDFYDLDRLSEEMNAFYK